MRGFAIFFCAFLLPLAAQDPEPPKVADPAAYESFFQTVLSYQSSGDHLNIVMNGEPVTRKPTPKLQDVIGLTDSEVETLASTATNCIARVREALPQAKAEILELRFRNIESGTVSAASAEAESKVDRDHYNIVIDHIQQLKAAYGEVRFKVLDDYVRSGKARKDLALILVVDTPTKK